MFINIFFSNKAQMNTTATSSLDTGSYVMILVYVTSTLAVFAAVAGIYEALKYSCLCPKKEPS
jgi:hypothetical protein